MRWSAAASSSRRWFAAASLAMPIVILTCSQAWPSDGLAYISYTSDSATAFPEGEEGPSSDRVAPTIDDSVRHPWAAELWENWSDKGNLFWSEPPGDLVLTIDYRVQPMFNSHTSYQFGTAPSDLARGLIPAAYAPLSKLDWSLDSTWTGFRFGLEKADSAAHFEWLTPMQQGINGNMEDFDWSGPNKDPASLSRSPERWNDGQMLDLEYEFRLLKRPLGLPVDVWPMIGFRWQRFSMTAYDGDQIINDGTLGPDLPPVGYHWTEDEITFKQEYSIGYLGAQLRGRLETKFLPPIAWTLQGDWGYTQANNVDHHISGYEDRGSHRYTMEDTHGDALHFCLTAESLFCRDRFSIGLQADYMEINTTGSHHWVQYGGTYYAPADETWTNGVSVSSYQTSLTAFIRTRF